MSVAVEHRYRYPTASALVAGRLSLATSPASSTEGASPFLQARVRAPRRVALALRLVSDVVRSRHHIPAAMLERIVLESDPVLTWGGDTLRVEGLSSCCGLYVRADVEAAMLDASTQRPGTTNVDFNAPMRAALANVRDDERLELTIGDEGLELGREDRAVVERKVRLPLRWLRGLVEVQAIQRRMEPRLRLGRVAATRLLRSLPRSGRSSDVVWVVPAGAGSTGGGSARLGSAPRPGAVRIAGLARLAVLEAGLPLARELIVHEDPVTGASAWRLDGDGVAVTVALSPQTWRGFSGEGQVLRQLATTEPQVAQVRALLRWQSELSPERLAADARVDAATAEGLLAWLATRGLVGYDVSRGAWFHRVLPFDLAETRRLLDRQHPRLEGARKLLEAGAVVLRRRHDAGVEAEVQARDVTHRVRLDEELGRCTCTWFAKHQGERGPCKHVLAVEMALAHAAPRR